MYTTIKRLSSPLFSFLLSLFLLSSASESRIWAQGTQPVQVVPDCLLSFTFTAAGSLPATATPNSTGDNRSIGCDAWTLVYQSSGFSALTLTFQSAAGAVTAGTFGTFTGTVSTGINPNTSIVGALSGFTGYVGWYRVTLGGLTGSGTVRGVLYGYRTGSGGSGGGGGGGGGSTGCVNQNAFTVTATTDVVMQTAVTGKKINVCTIIASWDNTANVTVQQGTGSVCGTSTVALSGPLGNLLGLAFDLAWGPLNETVAARDICLHFSASVTGGGFIIYGTT